MRVGLHVTAQRLAEAFAHGAVFALGQLLSFEQEVGREGDGDGFGGGVIHGLSLGDKLGDLNAIAPDDVVKLTWGLVQTCLP